MLNELNTKPGVAYLTRIVHAEETFMHHGSHGAGHDDHGAEHDDHGDSHEHGSDAGHDDGHGHKEKAH